MWTLQKDEQAASGPASGGWVLVPPAADQQKQNTLSKQTDRGHGFSA
jgi:hypothetical protein